MSDDRFTFAMGDFNAEFPTDRHYASNHMWAKPTAPEQWRFGLTAYAVRLLQDIYFLDWTVEPSTVLKSRANIGSIESKKAESDLFSPLAGELIAINESTLDDPSLINADTYGDGWLVEIRTNEDSSLLTPDAYAEHLIQAWDVAQRTIKGPANLD